MTNLANYNLKSVRLSAVPRAAVSIPLVRGHSALRLIVFPVMIRMRAVSGKSWLAAVRLVC